MIILVLSDFRSPSAGRGKRSCWCEQIIVTFLTIDLWINELNIFTDMAKKISAMWLPSTRFHNYALISLLPNYPTSFCLTKVKGELPPISVSFLTYPLLGVVVICLFVCIDSYMFVCVFIFMNWCLFVCIYVNFLAKAWSSSLLPSVLASACSISMTSCRSPSIGRTFDKFSNVFLLFFL